MSKISILHLSDVHFKKKQDEQNKTFRHVVQQKLIYAVEAHSKKHGPLDVVAVTGDIAFSGKRKEYDEALDFFEKFKAILPRNTEFLVVPGNHDVDRGEIDEFLEPYYVVKNNLVDKFLQMPEQIMRKINVKFKAFMRFSERLNPLLYKSKQDYFWVRNIKAKNISFLGLNSAWASEGDDDRLNIALGYKQVKDAFKKSAGIPNKILLMHHPPLNWLNDLEFGPTRVEIFNNCRLILCGHNHADEAITFKDPSDNCIILGANASYTNDKNGFIGFQFVNVEFSEKGTFAKVWPYIFNQRRNDFVPDRERNIAQHGKENFTIHTFRKLETTELKAKPSLKIPDEYKLWIREFHSRMPVDQLSRKGEVIAISLQEVYIPLETTNPFFKGKKEIVPEVRIKKEKKEEESEEPALINIETLLGRVNFMLLRGMAGMGKTTLVKHLSYTITHGLAPAGLTNYLPVLIFIKDLWPIYKEKIKNTRTFESILKFYLEKNRCPLDMETIDAYLSENRVLFLFDGLDEVPDSILDDLVDVLHQFWFNYNRNRFLFTGRPHGFSEKVIERFGANFQDIENLDNKKIEDFINKWFMAISGQASGYTDLTSTDMINDIKLHEHVAVFTQNPLLLTAVCILYLVGGKRVPEQRADLYDRIVENLLHRRFNNPAFPTRVSAVREYLMQLAFMMQKSNLKSIDVYEAKELLKEIYTKNLDEKPFTYKKRIDMKFDEIEPNCDLLNRLSSGELEFFHLSFQEFLSAKYLIDMDINYKGFLEKSWWKETILLYTGLMNIEMKKRSNDIVRKILGSDPSDKKKKHYLWLLGSEALRNFQPLKREDHNVSLAREKLCLLINSDTGIQERFEAGEVLSSLGDMRIRSDTMIKVKGGEFIRGSDEIEADSNVKPERKIYLDDFIISIYPITNEEYKEFVNDDGYENRDYWTENGWEWLLENGIIEPRFWHDRKWNGSNFPVVGISWYEASAFAEWLSSKTGNEYRLPTEAEWEKAARGSNGLLFPWGNKFYKSKCNSADSGLDRTSPVGIFPEDESPYGCQDMAGNVLEWCSDWYAKDYYLNSQDINPKGTKSGIYRICRGGSWQSGAVECRTVQRSCKRPSFRSEFVGFRLARSIKKLHIDIHRFLEKAGFKFQFVPNTSDFIAISKSRYWRQWFSEGLYVCLYLNSSLDQHGIQSILHKAKKYGNHALVVINQQPKISAWIAIAGLRADDKEQFMLLPISESLIKDGIASKKERDTFNLYVNKNLGKGFDPYDVRDPVSDAVSFFGREGITDEMLDALKIGKRLGLFGLHKIGKSSVLQRLQKNSEFPVSYIYLRDHDNIVNIYHRILNGWWLDIRTKYPSIEWRVPKLTYSNDIDAKSELNRAINDLLSILEKATVAPRLGIFLDEIDKIVPYMQGDEKKLTFYINLMDSLRGLQQEIGSLSLLVAGVHPILARVNYFWGDQKNPMHQVISEKFLPPLEEESCEFMIRCLGEQVRLTYSTKALNYIIQKSGSHPFLARQICSLIYKEIGESGNVSIRDVRRITDIYVRDPAKASYFDERGLWGELGNKNIWGEEVSKANHAILRALAESDGELLASDLCSITNSVVAEQAFIELKERSIISPSSSYSNYYYITFGLFRDWIRLHKLKEE